MNTQLITFATSKYFLGAERLVRSAKDHFGHCTICGPECLDHFMRRHPIMRNPRGFGYWAWKPYIILKALRDRPGASVMYSDSLVDLVSSPGPLFNLDADITLFDQEHVHGRFTRRDCLMLMGCDTPEARNGLTLNAAYCIFHDTFKAREFLTEWLEWCLNEQAIGDVPSVLAPEHPEFVDHRHDQSILTNLALLRGIMPHPSPCQNEMRPRPYPQVVNHHRQP